MSFRWIVIPDLQVPYHDRKAVASVQRFVAAVKPDGLLIVGDELDAPQPSRWNKGFAGEYSATLQKDIDECHSVLAGFRSALGHGGPIHLSRSNHGDRIRTYINRYAPALRSLRGLDYEGLLGLSDLGITFHEKPYVFAPGWALAHCDEGGSSQTAGGTALALAKKWGVSVVGGHTHKAGIQHAHLTVNGRIMRHLFGIESGNLMDFRKADYLKANSANWQQAITIIDVDGKHVLPQLVPIFNSTVVYQGVTY